MATEFTHDEQEWSLTRKERILGACLTVYFPALILAICVLSSVSAQRVLEGYAASRVSKLAIGCGVLFTAQVVNGFARMKSEQWLRATFQISSRGAAKVMPSGIRVQAHWSDLVRVSSGYNLLRGECIETVLTLEFSDGTRISIPTVGEFAQRMLRAAVSASGPDSVLSRKLDEARHVSPKTFMLVGVRSLVAGTAFVILAWLFFGKRNGELLSALVMLALALTGLNIVPLVRRVKRREK